MANGDTKTEAMLNVLGNGGTGDEFRGCCNTKTQSYILDAIDRINAIQPGGSSDFNDLENRPQLNGVAMTGNTNITNFVGTDGQTAGAQGLVPAPATTDADKFLKSDGTWATAGGGGGDTVYSDKSTSASANGGSVYIGNKDSSQVVQTDPTNANTARYFVALPWTNTAQGRNGMVNILGAATGVGSVAVGQNAKTDWQEGVAVGPGAHAYDQGSIAIGPYCAATGGDDIAIGRFAQTGLGGYGVYVGYSDGSSHSASGARAVCLGAVTDVPNGVNFSVALGANAQATRTGEVNVGLVTDNTTSGYNGTAYRVIGGVHDAVDDHDAVTLGQLNTLITNLNLALGTAIPLLGNANNANNNSGSVIAPTVTCPFCGQETDAASTICQNCGSDMTSTPYDPGTGEEPGPEIPPEDNGGEEPVEEPAPDDMEAPSEG